MVLLVDLLAELGELRRGCVHLRTVHVHQGLSEGLLIVASADHEDGGVYVEDIGNHRQSGSPLSGSGLRGQGVDARLGVVVGLGEGRVALMASEGTHVLPLEVDLRRSLEVLLEAVGPLERGRPVEIDHVVPDLLGDVDVPLGGALLLDDGLAEDGGEVLGLRRLLGHGIERGLEGLGKVGREVVPSLRYLLGVQRDACIFWN